MRGFRSTFILLVVLTGLLGYIYYGMKPGSQPVADQKPRVFTLETDKIEELQVKASGGEVSALKKVDGAWQVVAPVQAKADEAEVSGILTNLASLENQRVVDESPADLAQFGLAPARVEVGFRKTGDKDVTRIQFGDKTATGGDLYAKRPAEKRVFLVSSFIETTFDRTSFDLRDKTILTFPRDQADQVEVVSADQSLSLKKSGDRWSIAEPIAARADSTVVDGLIGRLQTSQMKSIAAVAPAPEELKTFGLDKPAITATVGAGSSRATLTVGKESPDGATLYARDAARPMVFTIEKSLADDLRKKAADYRPKDVFEFRPFMATKIDITRDGSTFVFAKSTDKDGKEKWTRANPAKDLDGTKVDALLAALSGLQVFSYVDAGAKAGIVAPALTIAVTFDDGKKEERVVFGRVGTDVFATRAGEPGAAKVEAAKFDEALAAIDALK